MTEQGSAQRPARSAVLAVVGCTLLVSLLVAWAALIGPGRVLEGQGPDRYEVIPTASETVSDEVGATPELYDEVGRGDLPRLVSWLAAGLVDAAALVLLAGLVLGLRRLWRLRPRLRERTGEVPFEVVDAPALAADAIMADAVAQRRLLVEGDPRNAIVSCWHRFEAQAAGVGMPRRAWETSSEHVMRILELAEADSVAASRLSALFREARFSHHEVTEESRGLAIRALDDLHAGLVRSQVHG